MTPTEENDMTDRIDYAQARYNEILEGIPHWAHRALWQGVTNQMNHIGGRPSEALESEVRAFRNGRRLSGDLANQILERDRPDPSANLTMLDPDHPWMVDQGEGEYNCP